MSVAVGDVRGALGEAVTNRGESVLALSERGDVLVVFLRHFGCTFCREAAQEVSEARGEIEREGVTLCFVYMPGEGGDVEGKAAGFFARYGLDDAHRVADPERRLYRAFGLGRGSASQLFGPRVWARGFVAGVLQGHWVGKLVGDGFQMPGVFVVRGGEVVRGYVHEHAGSRPDYCGLARG